MARAGGLTVRILFPYMARWRSANWSRYHHLLGALAARGHEVIVLQAPARPGAQETNYLEIDSPLGPGIRVVDVRVPTALWQRHYPLDKLVKKGLVTVATRLAARALARQVPIDVLLLYNAPQVVLLGALHATVVVDLADDLLAMLAHEVGGWARPLVMPPARLALGTLLASADVVTTSSAVLAERYGERVQVLPNGADLAATAQADGSAVRARYAAPIVGFVGAFEYFVDFDLVLDTAARLPHCSFVLVGGGRDLARVRAAVARRALRNVVLPGPVDYRTALDYMAAFDVALAPFYTDAVGDAASPLKLFEYAALHRPLLCTPAAEMQRIAGDWAHFGATADEWAAHVEAILAAPEATMARTAAGYGVIANRYRWDWLAESLERMIVDALRARGRHGRATRAPCGTMSWGSEA